MSAENKALVRRYVDEVYNANNLEHLEEFISPDYVNHMEAQEVTGIEGLRGLARDMHAALPDMRHTVHIQLTEGDKEVHRWTITGTHRGDWMGVPASDNEVAIEGLTLVRLEHGKVAEEWTFANSLEMLVQIGALPADVLDGT